MISGLRPLSDRQSGKLRPAHLCLQEDRSVGCDIADGLRRAEATGRNDVARGIAGKRPPSPAGRQKMAMAQPGPRRRSSPFILGRSNSGDTSMDQWAMASTISMLLPSSARNGSSRPNGAASAAAAAAGVVQSV